MIFWYLSIFWRGRCLDRFYTYIGFGRFLLPPDPTNDD